MRAGEDLETLVARHLKAALQPGDGATIETNARLQGPEGPRQIDVVLRSQVGPFDHLTIVECKDHSRMVTVKEVDALESVTRDVKANKAVLISRRGFSKNARKKADRLGITLMRADNVSTISQVAFDIPVHVVEYAATSFHLNCKFDLYVGPDCQPLINEAIEQILDAGVQEMVRARVSELMDRREAGTGELRIGRTDLANPIVFRNSRGDESPVEWIVVSFEVTKRRFQGALSDLTTATYLHDETKGSTTAYLAPEHLAIDYESDFAEFTAGSDPGTTPLIEMTTIVLPPPDAFQVIGGMAEGDLADPQPGGSKKFRLPLTPVVRRPDF